MGATKEILDFFDEETLEILIGSKSKLSIEFDPEINGNDGVKFKNKEVDSLLVKSLGSCKYTDLVLPLTLLNIR